MDFWFFDLVEEHQRNDRERPLLGHFTRFVKREFACGHPTKIDPCGKTEGITLVGEAGETMHALMAEATISVAGRVVKYKEIVREGRL